jgi:LAO/AO transport system kinase
VLVETLGVGQAETAAAQIVDLLVLVLPPSGGDELQGIKRGIVEIADLVLVNKADGELAAAARRTQADYASALRLMRPRVPGWQVPVRAVSALTGSGVAGVWDDVARFRAILETGDLWTRRRAEQALAALWSEIGEGLIERFRAAPRVARGLAAIEAEIRAGRVTPSEAARRLLDAFERG